MRIYYHTGRKDFGFEIDGWMCFVSEIEADTPFFQWLPVCWLRKYPQLELVAEIKD